MLRLMAAKRLAVCSCLRLRTGWGHGGSCESCITQCITGAPFGGPATTLAGGRDSAWFTATSSSQQAHRAQVGHDD
jgi:hypothetical protein